METPDVQTVEVESCNLYELIHNNTHARAYLCSLITPQNYKFMNRNHSFFTKHTINVSISRADQSYTTYKRYISKTPQITDETLQRPCLAKNWGVNLNNLDLGFKN